jgi:tetratricopeptide (TPR) repeat protein
MMSASAAAQAPQPAPGRVSVPAAPTSGPLANVAVLPLAATGKPIARTAHHGQLVAVLTELALVQSARVNVVSQGAQAEMLDELGVGKGHLTEDVARKIARLSGATHVFFGTFGPQTGEHPTYQLQVFALLTGQTSEVATVSAPLAEAQNALASAVSKHLGLAALPAAEVPLSEKSQRGLATCATFAAIALERAGIKGRKVLLSKEVLQACADAESDPQIPLATGMALTVRVLSKDGSAAPNLQHYVERHGQDRLAVLALIRHLFELAEIEKAAALVERVRADRPRDPDVLRFAGELEIQKDNWNTARLLFAQAVTEAPNSPYLRYRLSYASYRADDPSKALENARAALRLSGDAPFYQLNLAERLLDAGNLVEATLQLERSVKQTPQRFTARVRLGYVYLLMGELDKALAQLQAAEKITPTEKEKDRGVDALLKVNLARVHAAKGNAKESVKYLKALQKTAQLEKADLEHPEFQALKEDRDFKKLANAR